MSQLQLHEQRGTGWFGLEPGPGGQSFHWTSAEWSLGSSRHDADAPYLLCAIESNFPNPQRIAVFAGERQVAEWILTRGRAWYALAVPEGAEQVTFRLSALLPPDLKDNDPRPLGVKIYSLRRVGAVEVAEKIPTRENNRRLNDAELWTGRAALRSYPQRLGVDLHGKCNIVPRCVYCPWDRAKATEGAAQHAVVATDTFLAYGPFFENAYHLTNCSIGEPLLSPRIGEVLNEFARREMFLEITTNGLVFDACERALVLGRRIRLYVSLDAATSTTYARLRTDAFDAVCDNVRGLCEAKRDHGGLPEVMLVFIPVKMNLGEAVAFVDLAKALGVDHAVIRPLELTFGMPEVERAGVTFRYKDQILPASVQARAVQAMQARGREIGQSVLSQTDFGAEDDERAERNGGPICSEPWTSMYLLRRGFMPCAYSSHAIAPWGTPPEQVWNSPFMQQLRRDLAAGRLNDHCRACRTCPIVQRRSAGQQT
jgi:MoaA/NifB/PqqE/SkfB family radical SAM enzyme